MTLDELCSPLLPPDEHLHFETLLLEDHHLTLLATMTAAKAVCPDCGHPSHRIHSGYCRPLADLPWALMPVALRVRVRRFCCDSPLCTRLPFTERVPRIAPLYARTTTRLRQRQAETGLALGGAAGARPLARHAIPASRSPVLRRVRGLPPPTSPPPHVVGIDDGAWRKGQRYGTLVVDLAQGCPSDVLEDRAADTVAAWLQAHPDVTIVARDRAEAYAAGIRQGAPEATQVADRWHLLKHVASALQEVFSAHHREMDTRNHMQPNAPRTPQDDSGPVSMGPPVSTTRAQQQIAHNRARRVAAYAQAHALRQQGWTMQAIATHMGRHHRTVRKYLEASTLPARPPRRRPPSILDPYKAYLLERWQAGCRSVLELYREMHAQGFAGQSSIVAASVSRLRPPQGQLTRRRRAGSPATSIEVDKPLTPSRAPWLVMRREATLNDADKQQLTELQGLEGEIGTAIMLPQDFAALVRQRHADQLDSGLERATASGLQAFQSLAKGLRADFDAVKAGVALRWSTGPVEGQINRLKMLKRQMYGRAHMALLRQRVLLPT